jgi:hypothetical protein
MWWLWRATRCPACAKRGLKEWVHVTAHRGPTGSMSRCSYCGALVQQRGWRKLEILEHGKGESDDVEEPDGP